MKIIQNIVIGGLTMFVGFALYPPYINYIYTPLYTLFKGMFPDLPVEQEVFWRVFPFVILLAIVGGGIMWFAGKKSLPSNGGDSASGGK